MKLSELLYRLQDIMEKQGDGLVIIDIPERNTWVYDFLVDGRYYQGNLDYDIPNTFIIIEE